MLIPKIASVTQPRLVWNGQGWPLQLTGLQLTSLLPGWHGHPLHTSVGLESKLSGADPFDVFRVPFFLCAAACVVLEMGHI